MSVVLETPAWARLDGASKDDRDLVRLTSYRDQRAAYEVKRFIDSQQARLLEPGEYALRLEKLKAAVKCSLLRPDGEDLLVPAGLAWEIADAMGWDPPVLEPPAPRPLPWHHRPTKVLRDYQEQAVDLLLQQRHGAVALPPGTGKTLIIQQIVRELGLPTVVFSPSKSIVQQTYRELLDSLGPRVVGLYGDGKKDLSKRVTVATTQSLLKVTGEAEAFFREKLVIAGDESHTLAADAMSRICLDLLRDAPYRFFLSGTQARHDGLRPLLQGVIGPVVLDMSVEEAVGRGALVPQRVRMIEVLNGGAPKSRDPGRATRQALYASKRVNATVGNLVNEMVAMGRPCLVLVDELPQFACLLPFLRHEARFAHGCTDKKRLKAAVPPAYWEADALELSDQFNEGRFPILVGTSCIGMGVDVRATGAGFYLRGGKAENDIRQFCGRTMRLFPGKSDVWTFDVDVMDGEIVHRHAEAREKIWRDIYNDFQRVVL